jgi:hypothetical protein
MGTPIYKISEYVNWNNPSAVSPGGVGGGGGTGQVIDLSNYYTKIELQTAGQSSVSWENITGIDFVKSIEMDSSGEVSLVGDEADPGILKYYGTNVAGIKGWFDILVEDSSGNIIVDQYWEDDSLGDLNTVLGGAGVYIDGLFIKNYIIDAQDGSLKHLTVTAGDASGAVGTTAGDLILKAGDAILGDDTSTAGTLFLTPGNLYSAGAGLGGGIVFGGESYNNNFVWVYAQGIQSNVGIGFVTQGLGSITFTASLGYIGLDALSVDITSPDIILSSLTGASLYNVTNWNATGISLTIHGGDVLGDAGTYNGGDVHINGGVPYGGTTGKIYIGTGSAGTNPLAEADSAITHVLMYDTSTGEVTYGDGSGGTGEILPFQTISFDDPLEIDATLYKDWICDEVSDDTTINLNNTVDGDAGQIELIMDSAGGYTVAFGTMFTKKMGLTFLDTSAGADNVISWRRVGTEIVYTIGIIV